MNGAGEEEGEAIGDSSQQVLIQGDEEESGNEMGDYGEPMEQQEEVAQLLEAEDDD